MCACCTMYMFVLIRSIYLLVVVCIACDHHVKPLSPYHNRCYSIVFLSLNELTSGGRSIREKFTTSIPYSRNVL